MDLLIETSVRVGERVRGVVMVLEIVAVVVGVLVGWAMLSS